MTHDPDEFEFYYHGMPVGYFEEPAAPSAPGRYHYMPYQGPGHFEMHQSCDAGGRPRCCLRTPGRAIFFSIVDCPEHGLLEIQDVTFATPRQWPPAVSLEQVLTRTLSGGLPCGCVYLPSDHERWDQTTAAVILDDEVAEELDPEAYRRGYRPTVDTAMVEQIVRAAHEHLGADSLSTRLEAFTYYARFHAFLPRLGAPDPTGRAEAQVARDRAFYDGLGAEQPDVRCRAAGCNRGAVQLSVFCRMHHFEQVRNRPCPFHH